MTSEQILKQYPESEPWKRAAFLLYHGPDMLYFYERYAILQMLSCLLHEEQRSQFEEHMLQTIDIAFVRNMKLIKGVDITKDSEKFAKPQGKQSPEQELTL